MTFSFTFYGGNIDLIIDIMSNTEIVNTQIIEYKRKEIVYDNGENYVLILIKSRHFLINLLR